MSVEDAHAFIVRVRENPGEVGSRENLTIDRFIEAGRAAGYAFDEDDLRAAHAHDWVLRGLAFRSQADAGSVADPESRAANPRAKAR